MDEGLANELRGFGIPEEQVQAALKTASGADDVEVFDDNLLSATVFKRMGTQWVLGGMNGIAVGLNYAAFPVVAQHAGVKPEDIDQVFEDVQLMEGEALKVFAEKTK